ncbi:hypothetical protein ElyMa_002095700 [Elysia marginata]|uniref:Hedgehog N-terminal signalling domain-containing protein n=1 Tax=Elysia marginata TaxID=1093978 RepID=A0AAV4FF12_9GAST|nr:hypothetical protein ElyMa_002095700 [Elysia marginata]
MRTNLKIIVALVVLAALSEVAARRNTGSSRRGNGNGKGQTNRNQVGGKKRRDRPQFQHYTWVQPLSGNTGNANGSPAAHTSATIDGTGNALDDTAKSELFRLHRSIRFICWRAKIVDVASPSSYDGPKKTAKTVTFDEELTIELRQQ